MVRLEDLLAGIAAAASTAQARADASATEQAKAMAADPLLVHFTPARPEFDGIEIRVPAAIAPLGARLVAGGQALAAAIAREIAAVADRFPVDAEFAPAFAGSARVQAAWRAARPWLDGAIRDLLAAPPGDRQTLIERIVALFYDAPAHAPRPARRWWNPGTWFARIARLTPIPSVRIALTDAIAAAIERGAGREPLAAAAAVAAGADGPGSAAPPGLALIVDSDAVARVDPSVRVSVTITLRPGLPIESLIERADANAKTPG